MSQAGGQGAPQAARPTVGDTLTVVHRARVAPGTLVQPRGPTDSSLATLLAPPLVSREGDSVRIAYSLAVWQPGSHRIVIPGAVTVAGDGRVDTLPDATVTLQVASVLPSGVRAESIAPQAARPWVPRSEASAWPFAVLVLPVLLLLAAAALWWRRRGRAPLTVAASPTPGGDERERLARWAATGEAALVIDHLLATLPATEEATGWRREVEVLRFDPSRAVELDALVRRGLDLHDRARRAG